MPGKTHVIVKVSSKGGRLLCTPDWVHLLWKKGPADIRWVFGKMPGEASRAVVEFHEKAPAKYAKKAKSGAKFRSRGVHLGAGHAETSGRSHLPDIVTSGNIRKAGYFTYDIKILNKKGAVIAQADPGGDNNSGSGGGGG
jgi:hypothetical protein